jgi:hypothetical protein
MRASLPSILESTRFFSWLPPCAERSRDRRIEHSYVNRRRTGKRLGLWRGQSRVCAANARGSCTSAWLRARLRAVLGCSDALIEAAHRRMLRSCATVGVHGADADDVAQQVWLWHLRLPDALARGRHPKLRASPPEGGASEAKQGTPLVGVDGPGSLGAGPRTHSRAQAAPQKNGGAALWQGQRRSVADPIGFHSRRGGCEGRCAPRESRTGLQTSCQVPPLAGCGVDERLGVAGL